MSKRLLLLIPFVFAPLVFLLARQTPRPPDPATQARERAATPTGMVYVPGGWFVQGTDDPDADADVRPARRVFVPSFYIEKTEVTNRAYQKFCPDHSFPHGEENFPATNKTYDEVAQYAKWAGRQLPTEAAWEKAARGGSDNRRYPWGDTWDSSRLATRRKTAGKSLPLPSKKLANACAALSGTRVQPVGQHPNGASPYGALDMAGNAWEWVQGFYDNDPNRRIIRGGAVGYGEHACRVYARGIEGSGVT